MALKINNNEVSDMKINNLNVVEAKLNGSIVFKKDVIITGHYIPSTRHDIPEGFGMEASSTETSSYSIDKAFDGLLSTKWRPKFEDESPFFIVMLDKLLIIKEVEIISDACLRLKISGSKNNKSYTVLKSTAIESSTSLQHISINAKDSYKYIKVEWVDGYANIWGVTRFNISKWVE